MKKVKVTSVLAAIIVLSMNSCSKDSGGGNNNFTVDCNTVTNKAWTANVSPIIQSSCAVSNCHAAGSTNGPGPLTTHAEVSAVASSVRNAVSNGSMPKNGSLSSSQKSSIICWIDSGAPFN